MNAGRLARLMLVLGVVTPLTGCASAPSLTASWYFVYKPAGASGQAGSPTASPDASSEQLDDIVVALLNRGTRSTTIKNMRINDRPSRKGAGMDLIGEDKMIGAGQLVLLRSGLVAQRCIVPLRLWVRVEKYPFWQVVPVRGTTPTSLPDDWLSGSHACRVFSK